MLNAWGDRWHAPIRLDMADPPQGGLAHGLRYLAHLSLRLAYRPDHLLDEVDRADLLLAGELELTQLDRFDRLLR